jgi:tRNA A-37 threonylcarbamoyl transferase component Bud32
MPDSEDTADDPTRLTRPDGVLSLDSFAPRKRIVHGTGPDIATETRDLLHRRLRASAIMLAVGVGAFLVRDAFLPRLRPGWIYFHGLILVLQLVTVGALSGRWRPSLRQLRSLELGMFTTIVVALILGQFLGYQIRVRLELLTVDYLRILIKNSILSILLVIFTYAIFIPNDGKRAARVIATMALATLVAPLAMAWASPEFTTLARQAVKPERLSENGLFLLLGTATAIFGTHIINTIRTREFHERQFNQYALGRKLGSGGMGEVYYAEHRLLKRPCAIKLIKSNLSHRPRVHARFELEVRATARLSHWNTVEVWDYGRTEDGTYYYVMEYLPGLSLQQLVDRHGPLEPARIVHLLGHACGALHEAHHMGLIHRDLKPPNIFAAYRGGQFDVAKLLDFGLVKATRDEDSPALTREGMITGSPLYMAPEQIMRTHPSDPRTDIYGMGAIGYFLLTGRPPFVSTDAMEVMVAHARDPVVPPSQYRAGVPDDLEKVVLRCLEKNPDLRYQTALELAGALFGCEVAGRWSPSEAARWWGRHEPETSGELEPRAPEHRAVPAAETVAEDETPSLAASEVEMGLEPGSGDGVGASLTVAENPVRRERS